MKVLVIAAHPDDEVLGCGGTVAQDGASGNVMFGILGEGLSSRLSDRLNTSPNELHALQNDARAAAAILGVTAVEFGGLADNRFDELPLLTVVKQVEGWIETFRPDVVYTHHPGDLNIDHGITFRAVLTATRPGASSHLVRDVLAFEVASSTEWAFQSIRPAFRPNVFVDIGSTIERKVEAMQRYRSEARVTPHPRSPEKIRALAEHRGAACGTQYAEAFELIRSVRA